MFISAYKGQTSLCCSIPCRWPLNPCSQTGGSPRVTPCCSGTQQVPSPVLLSAVSCFFPWISFEIRCSPPARYLMRRKGLIEPRTLSELGDWLWEGILISLSMPPSESLFGTSLATVGQHAISSLPRASSRGSWESFFPACCQILHHPFTRYISSISVM